MFYPERTDNIATKSLANKMSVYMASFLLNELWDLNKATSDYISSGKGKFRCGYTTQEEHKSCIGIMASNNPSKIPFAQLTRQLQSFGSVLVINSADFGHARQNGDLCRSSG